MDVLDPSIRRGLQIASYQRDELFHRSPSIIPTSLKMLVEPDPSERTLSLLAALHDEPFAVTREATHRGGDSQPAREDMDVSKSISELLLVAERINTLRRRYHNSHNLCQSAKAPSCAGAVDVVIENANIDSVRLNRVKDYYNNLLILNALNSGPPGERMAPTVLASKGVGGSSREASIKAVQAALNEVAWR